MNSCANSQQFYISKPANLQDVQDAYQKNEVEEDEDAFSVLRLCQLYALSISKLLCVECVKGVVIQPNINAGFPPKKTKTYCAVHFVEKSKRLFSERHIGVSATHRLRANAIYFVLHASLLSLKGCVMCIIFSISLTTRELRSCFRKGVCRRCLS